MNYPRGLVRYSTQAALEGKPKRILRTRTVAYGGLLLALTVAFVFAVGHRELIELDVMRDRNALYRTLPDSRIENVYTVRLINKDHRAHDMRLSVRGLAEYEVDSDRRTLHVAAESMLSAPVRIRVPAGTVQGGRDIVIVATAVGDAQIESTAAARFMGPVQ